ncbi:hypothetical protein Tco_0952513 [Tanacetum coccineum]|uniref:CCHC-type domain-containing protein n=1 Tax=Tanacetum coccineum TaxID=301880 RepID=A0ABQ5E031_9ASTR
MDQTILKSHVEKLEKFKGSDFRRWQHKMLFYLTSLHVLYVLTDSESTNSYVDGHNESLEKKYKTQVACSKKFVIGKLLNFKMNDAKPIVKQVEELQIIVHEMEVEGISINSNFLLGSIIEKLPQSWKFFKLYLKHLTDDMSFEQLVLKIRVEEDSKMNEKADANSIEPNPNMDGKKDYTQQKNNNFKKVYHYYVCGKLGHKVKNCRHKKEYGGGNSGGNSNQANHVESLKEYAGVTESYYYVCGKLGHKVKNCRHKKEYGGGNSRGNSNQANHVESPKEYAGVIESFLTTNVVDWWFDTGATKHICNLRRMFVSYQKVNEPEPLFTRNGNASEIEGKGNVILKLELDKFVITKGGVYVGKSYLDERLFKLSVVTDDNVINNNNAGTSTASMYMIDPSFLWHSSLGLVNFCSLQRMINLGMLPDVLRIKYPSVKSVWNLNSQVIQINL